MPSGIRRTPPPRPAKDGFSGGTGREAEAVVMMAIRALRQRSDQRIHHRCILHTETECVADNHLSLHSEGDGCFAP